MDEITNRTTDGGHTDAILRRLQQHYLDGVAVPGKNVPMSPRLFHRLSQAVLTEGYSNDGPVTNDTAEERQDQPTGDSPVENHS